MRMRPLLLASGVAVAVGAAVLAAGGAGVAQPTPGPTATPSPGVEPGEALYLRDCAWCHGNDGRGTNLGSSLTGVGEASADFMLRTGRMPIDTPEVQPEKAPPAYPPEQIEALVAYVGSLGTGPEIPEVDPGSGVMHRGALLYEEHCAACHSSTGIGAALTSGLIAPDVLESTPTEIAESVRIGGAGLFSGNMPEFDEGTIDEQALNDLIAYILALQEPHQRGGSSLQRLGPVAEGFVAFAVGLLLTVLLVRWIGKRAGQA